MLDFNTRAVRTVARLDETSTFGDLAVSPDGRTILYSQVAGGVTGGGSDLMLVENFR